MVPNDGAQRGGYVAVDVENPKIILIGTGSELMLCVDAAKQLNEAGVATRVVSMPSFELFEMQDAAWRESVLPKSVEKRIAVEAGIRMGWDRYIGTEGVFIGMDSFGASAPFEKLYEHFGITVEKIVAAAKSL